jgi:hypothetical protein
MHTSGLSASRAVCGVRWGAAARRVVFGVKWGDLAKQKKGTEVIQVLDSWAGE